jgi:hypothetical protein
MKTTKLATLICVTMQDIAVFISAVTGKVEEANICNDSEGKMYFMDGAKTNYLPKEFQPKLVIK